VQYRVVNVRISPAAGGKACPAKQKRNCSPDPCPIDCEYEFGHWGDCDKTCGGGYKRRSPIVSVNAAFGGKACPPNQKQYCQTDYCAVDCK
jgi:hypothetical protein